MSGQIVDFAIITAVEIELQEALRAFHLKDADRIQKDSFVYWRGRLDIGRGEHYEIVVAQTSDMGNVDSAVITFHTIMEWKPAALLLVGIAGSASEEVKLGDIVIGQDIYYYERGKVKQGKKRPEPRMYRADATLFNRIRSMPDRKIPRGKQPNGSLKRPNVHYGVIASGEKVIADKRFREGIADENRKILAVEMEGYGFSAAAWQSFYKNRHLVIRAICDRADRKKDDDWQPYAARIAFAFAKNFLLDRPIPPISASETKAIQVDTKAIKQETRASSPVQKSARRTAKSSRTSGFDVFISYSHDDSTVTRKIHEALRKRNVNAWIDYEQIKPGDVFVNKMEEGLTGSSSMILIVSPRSMRSGWVEEEYVTGISLTKQLKGSFRLIPVLIEEAKLPAFLSNRSWVDLREENRFDDQLNLLVKTILEDRPVRTKPLAVSDRAKKYLEYVAFLIFFPEGILEPILNKLVDTSQGQNAIDWSMKNGYLQTINLSGLQLIRIFPEKVNEISRYLRDKPAAASKLIGQFINRIFLEENPYLDVVELGFGRAILLRDLIEITKITKSDTPVEQDEICKLARKNLGHVIGEEFYRVAAEICEGLDEFCGFTSPRDIITKANLSTRIGQSKQAVQLFDLYRGDNLFEDSGLDDLDRIDAAMSWAKAVKESGAAGGSNAELIAAYDKMLSLLDPVIVSSKGMHSLLSLKADILNNRATQIAVYGTLEVWKRAREDFKLIFELYKQTGDDQRLIGAVSNYAAQTIDKSGNKPPFSELLSLFKKYDALADSMQPCEELFFYYYQKARLFKRWKPEHLSKAIEFYKISYDVALASELKRRYPIAKRWQLVLRRRRNDISENDFVTGLLESANTLRGQTQDSWALNALCDILIELAQTYKLRGELEKAWEILLEAYQHRVAQFTHSGSPTAKRGIVMILEKMDPVEVPPEKKAQFTRENNNTLNIVMESPRARMLDWKSIHQWLGEQGR